MAKYDSQMDPDQLEAAGKDPEPPAAAPVQSEQRPNLNLDALLAKYSEPEPTATPVPSSSSSISLGVPVYRNAPEVRQAATTEAATDLNTLKGSLAAAPEMTAEQKAQQVATIKEFQGKSGTNYQTSQDLINEHVKPLQAEADRLATQHQELIKAREEKEVRMQGAMDQMDTLSKSIAATQPREFWADQSTGMKIATIALTALGGATQVLNGDRTNAVTDSIDNLIKRDTAMQKMRFEKNQDDYANQKTLVGQMAQSFDRLEHAQDAAYVTSMNGVIGRLQALKPMLDSAQMRQNVDYQVAQLEMKAAETHTKLQENILGSTVRVNSAVAKTAVDLKKASDAADRARLAAGQKAEQERLKGEQTAITVPGYEQDPNIKKINARPQETQAVRDDLATTGKVSDRMDYLKKILDEVDQDPTKLASFQNQAEFQQALAQAQEALRGPGFGQTGSRMTDMLKKLETTAFTGGEWARFRPELANRLLTQAQKMIWDNLNLKAKSLGLRPIINGPERHPWFGEDK